VTVSFLSVVALALFEADTMMARRKPMIPEPTASRGLMYHLVIVRPAPAGQFTAQPLGVPEIRVVAPSPKEAVEQVQQALKEWVGSLYWVPVELPSPKGHAVHDEAGHAKDDPEFQTYLEEIRRYRQEVDERECSASSSTPTT
jgi:hypothetical protein